MLCRPAMSSDSLVSFSRNSGLDRIDSSRIECEIVLSSSSGSFFAFRPAAKRRVAFFIFQKDVCAFRVGQLQGDVEHRDQDFIQHTGCIQLARSFQKQPQRLQFGRFRLDQRKSGSEIREPCSMLHSPD